MNDDVERVLDSCEPPVREVARRACEVLLALIPDAVVQVDAQKNIGFGVGPGYRGLRFSVIPQRAHVTLGIASGASLPDPGKLMEGTGRVHRHVKLRRAEDLDRPELRELMAAAMALGSP